MTALPFLRDHGRVRSGQTVLINGASGSVGSAAVQLARHYGAHVIAVCSTGNVDRVRALGADEVIDYTREDFTRRRGAYHVVFDAVGKSAFSRCKEALTNGGIYLSTVPTLGMFVFADMLWTRLFGNKRAVLALTGLQPPGEKKKDLCFLKELAETGRIRAVIDGRYPWEDSAQTHHRVDSDTSRAPCSSRWELELRTCGYSGAMKTGGCACGAVRYALTLELTPVTFCHCSKCRRWHGHVGAYTAVDRPGLQLTEQRGLRWYAASPTVRRGFCGECGSSLLWDEEGAPKMSICAGTLDAPTGLRPKAHIYLGSKGDYYEVPEDGLLRREEFTR